jgi:hypothetical protein
MRGGGTRFPGLMRGRIYVVRLHGSPPFELPFCFVNGKTAATPIAIALAGYVEYIFLIFHLIDPLENFDCTARLTRERRR